METNQSAPTKKAPEAAKPKVETKSSAQVDALRKIKKEKETIQKSFDKLEKEINALQQEKIILESNLADPKAYADQGNFAKLDEQYALLISRIENLTIDYDAKFEALMTVDETIANLET